ncbi:hypothetical protein BUALT_Bualt12G0044200 [Buddleja alternifolia]|uniref:Uncharacterized protein n=1 Tax=Buddleja alternifolia TaxID=168488 RepID=A0AAV6WP04_9LAMI|nr:hypothetical protein BUALT_Bualt12G0044200 [Buddleja alternifolia]
MNLNPTPDMNQFTSSNTSEWLPNTGATTHMTPNAQIVEFVAPYSGPNNVVVGNVTPTPQVPQPLPDKLDWALYFKFCITATTELARRKCYHFYARYGLLIMVITIDEPGLESDICVDDAHEENCNDNDVPFDLDK